MSIRLRLILFVTALVAVFWAAAAVVSRGVLVEEITEITTNNLSVAALRLMPLALREVQGHEDEDEDEAREGDHEARELDEDLRFLTGNDDGLLSFELRDGSGLVRLRSFDAEHFGFPNDTRAGLREEEDLTTFTVTDRETGFSLVVAEPTEHRKEAISEATVALFTPLLLMVPLIALAIFFLSRQVVEPLRQLRQQISARGGSNFDQLDISDQPVELRPIANAIDRLLERLRTAMDAERDFAASSAHELRTPIAGALAQTQILKSELPDGPGRRRALEIEATLKRLAEFTDKLLQISRVDAEPHVHKRRENMGPVIDLIVHDFTQRADRPASISVQNRLGQDLVVAMDPDALAVSLRNLIENAILHGDGERRVELIIAADWSIHVINRGPVVPADVLNGLTKRFTRGDTLASGSGLGLSIVDRIMTQSGGALTLHSPAIGRNDGFEAVLNLP